MSPKKRKKRSRRRDLCIAGRLGWLVAGLFFTFLVFETFFRVAGFAITRFKRSAAMDGAVHTVLCEGDLSWRKSIDPTQRGRAKKMALERLERIKRKKEERQK